MTIDRKSLGININTVISTITLIVMVGGWIYYWANTVRDIEELKQFRVDHLKETGERRGQFDERLKMMEKSSYESDRKQDNLLYRVTVLESTSVQQIAQTQKLTEGLAEISGDLKVVKELLQRMEADRKRTSR